ncbi:MAG: TMEM175 family protein, partial [Actinomycetes bacterium]
PQVHGDAEPISDEHLLNSLLTTGAFFLAFVIGSIWPNAGYYSLLLVWAAQWVTRWVKRRPVATES